MLIDSSLCLLIAQEMADWLECPSNFTVNFPFDLYFSWLVDHKSFRNNLDTYHDYLLTEGTNTINNNISSKLCILPNFYCDTCNTNFYCNPNQERQWLLDFYTSTNGKHWKNNSNWNDSAIDHCDGWFGVSCCNTIPHFDTNYSNINFQNRVSVRLETLPYSCINGLSLDNNNVSGILPDYWPNSTILFYLTISGVDAFADQRAEQLSGRLPDWSQNLTNLAIIEFVRQSFSNASFLPGFGSSNCTIVYDLHESFQDNYVQIPEWNNQKYLTTVDLRGNKMNGTIPAWDDWIWPMSIQLAYNESYVSIAIWCELTGNIPKFNKNSCPTMNLFIASGCQLNGSIESFPNTVCMPDNIAKRVDITGAELDFSHNNFRGTLPLHTLTAGMHVLY